MNVIAAYGRKYTNIKAARADWFANKDFKIVDGPYINKADADQYGGAYPVRIRIVDGPSTGPITVTINAGDTE